MMKVTYLFLIFALPFFFSTNASANIKRTCDAHYRVEFTGLPSLVSSASYTLPVARFKTQGGCGNTVPNRCRKRAKNKAHSCMSSHWNNNLTNNMVPTECTGTNVKNYAPVHLADYVKEEVCDYLTWLGKEERPRATVKVYAVTRGKKGCKKTVELSRNFYVTCDVERWTNKPLKITKQFERTNNVSSGGQRIYDRFSKWRRKCPEYKCNGVRNNPAKYKVCIKRLPCVNDLGLFLNERDKRNNQIFSAQLQERVYKGCGRKAAQNVLRFFGINLTQSQVGKHVKGHGFGPAVKAIATYPSELRKGIKKILNNHGMKNINVHSYSGKNQRHIINELKRGFPVIALVDGGTHWITITGYKASKFLPGGEHGVFFVHDNWSNQVRSWGKTSLSFNPGSSFWSKLSNAFGGTSFKSGTIITFSS